jgi:excisionase family DNA binding protein
VGVPNEEWELWTGREVAKALKVSRSWVCARAGSGELPSAGVGGLLRFSRKAVRRFALPPQQEGSPHGGGLGSGRLRDGVDEAQRTRTVAREPEGLRGPMALHRSVHEHEAKRTADRGGARSQRPLPARWTRTGSAKRLPVEIEETKPTPKNLARKAGRGGGKS